MNLHTAALRTAVVLAAVVLAGCANSPNRAPVEDRMGAARQAAPAAATPGAVATTDAPARVLPGVENAGKPGYYSVKAGDTLIRIGLDHGQNWRDVARWNNIENINLIEVGQVLRVVPPATTATAAAEAVRPVAVAPRPAAAASVSTAAPTPGATTSPVGATPGAVPSASAAPTAPRDADEDVNWTWPANGVLATPFEEGRSKGLAITGKVGDAVIAAADGRVIYAGSGLRGYGNLIIIKHNATYLTAYAHNHALFVKEDQAVRRGQRIADMGATDAERVQLHFEIRRLGKPIDPAKLLPPR